MNNLGGVLAAMEQERLERLAEAAELLPEGEEDNPRFRKYRLIPKRRGLQRIISEALPEEERDAILNNLRIVRGG